MIHGLLVLGLLAEPRFVHAETLICTVGGLDNAGNNALNGSNVATVIAAPDRCEGWEEADVANGCCEQG
ncbi:MAG: hypothetical protein ABSG16_00015 [Candidatus Acidiferrum sp.]